MTWNILQGCDGDQTTMSVTATLPPVIKLKAPGCRQWGEADTESEARWGAPQSSVLFSFQISPSSPVCSWARVPGRARSSVSSPRNKYHSTLDLQTKVHTSRTFVWSSRTLPSIKMWQILIDWEHFVCSLKRATRHLSWVKRMRRDYLNTTRNSLVLTFSFSQN